MIKYLFTRNDLIGSKAISGASKYDFQETKETPSHFAIVFDDRWVFHSRMSQGVHVEPYYHFKKKNTVLCSLKRETCTMGEIECQLLQDQLVRKAYGRKYDKWAIAYFIWRIILKKLFNRPIPDKNKWESKNKWFCNELFELIFRQDLSMKTPNDLMWLLLEHPEFTTTEVFQ